MKLSNIQCKLVDTKWEEKVWRRSWEPRGDRLTVIEEWEEWEGAECLAESSKPKRNREERRAAKRAEQNNNEGVAWGGKIPEGVADREVPL